MVLVSRAPPQAIGLLSSGLHAMLLDPDDVEPSAIPVMSTDLPLLVALPLAKLLFWYV